MNNLTENKVFKTLVTAVVVVAVLVYLQVINFDFIAFDESDCITKNPNIQNGFSFDSVTWALTSLEGVNWHPVTWITHMMVSQFFGMNPGAHHFANVIFHVACSVLLLLLLYKITGCKWRSFFVFAVFALHPLHVESVAWVAERKDMLSALFLVPHAPVLLAVCKRRKTLLVYSCHHFLRHGAHVKSDDRDHAANNGFAGLLASQ